MTPSRFRGITASFWLAAFLVVFRAGATESNLWPVKVTEKAADGSMISWTGAGPFLFDQPSLDGGRVSGFRPIYETWDAPDGKLVQTVVLYPLFYYRLYGNNYKWSFFQLINRYGRVDGAPPLLDDNQPHTFDVWPFYFSRETGDPGTSYHSVFPIGGHLYDLLGYDKLSWVLFPLWAQTEKKGAITTYTPWPFIRSTHGAETGFAVWPLFGESHRPGLFDRHYYLWPFFWNNTVYPGPDAPPDKAPLRQVGAMPFYSSDRGPDVTNVNYFLFFGTTDRTAPIHYHETRYFWPFFLQGQGDDRQTDRWAPFYTHSVIKGLDKTWIMWPLIKHTDWVDGDIAQDKTQFMFFFYWKLQQHKVSNPAAPPAQKTYLWPVLSTWDNGAGRRQVQILSPFEGVFADNDEVRQSWTPFLALYRYDQRAPGQVEGSVLWNAVTWKRNDALGSSEFHFGPLFSIVHGPAYQRYSLAGGLVGFENGSARGGFRVFCMEFQPRRTILSALLRH